MTMKIYNDVSSAQELSGCCITIGFFDGVHLGHQQILNRLIACSRELSSPSLIITFDRHPSQLLAPLKAPPLIMTLAQRIAFLSSFSPDGVLVLPFSESLSQLSAVAFLSEFLYQALSFRGIVVGKDFCFGSRRSGRFSLIEEFSSRNGVLSIALNKYHLLHCVVSSTSIRQCLFSGDVAQAALLLGRPYFIEGEVVSGRRVGREIGFPTANIATDNQIFLPYGVYSVTVDSAVSDKTLPGIASWGKRPTLSDGPSSPLLEVHLPGFSGDLYGKILRVHFHHYIRPEKCFGSLAELQDQIRRDLEDLSCR